MTSPVSKLTPTPALEKYSSMVDPLTNGFSVSCEESLRTEKKTEPHSFKEFSSLYQNRQGEFTEWNEAQDERYLKLYTEIRDPRWFTLVLDPLNLNTKLELKERLEHEKAGTFMICYSNKLDTYFLFKKNILNNETSFEQTEIRLCKEGYRVPISPSAYTHLENFEEIIKRLRLIRGISQKPQFSTTPPNCLKPQPQRLLAARFTV